VPPSLVVLPLLALILSQVWYAFWPGRRPYPAVLALTCLGVALGQAWDAAGLPSIRLGEADLVPAAVFGTALQALAGPAADRWRAWRERSRAMREPPSEGPLNGGGRR
jgi:hypothetical protein